jgi:signal transduction histidine kinase
MTHESEKYELASIAKALEVISKEISYEGLAKVLLHVALEYSGAVRGAVLLSEGGDLLAKADADFPRERARVFVSLPPVDDFRLPPDLSERVLMHQETVVGRDSGKGSALMLPAMRLPGQDLTLLCLPLIHQERTIGVLYLESEHAQETFTARCVSVMSILASQAAVSFASTQLFAALRETNMWMVRGQQIGRMGSYRWNTRTMLSRVSRECHRIFDIDLDVNPVPFEVFKSRVHPEDLPAVEQNLADSLNAMSGFRHEYRVVHRDGSVLNVVAAGQFDLGPSGDFELEGIVTDVTEQKAADQALTHARTQLARAAHLASLGELAGSIVHEVAQPLTIIVASGEACLRWLAREPTNIGKTREFVEGILEQGLRLGKIVDGLRSLVRGGQPQFAELHVHEAIEEVLLLLKRELERAGVTIRTDFERSAPSIEADRVQLQQVILNLVRNAIDAMADVDGRARVVTISSKITDHNASVAITDTGTGIDPAISERLFDSLYTTKSGGLGLGLSICRKIINAHGGRLWTEKNPNYGATFAFAIPLRQTAHRLNGN